MRAKPQECHKMAQIRDSIDQIDRDLMKLLGERAGYIDRAAEIKSGVDLPARVDDRVEEVVHNARKNALEYGMDPDLGEKLWRILVEWSIDREETKMAGEAPLNNI